MKMPPEPRLPQGGDRTLVQRLTEIFRDFARTTNDLSEGRMSGSYNAVTSAPTTGVYAVGDFVKNSAPAELGAAGSKYVIAGFMCVTAPLTFVQCRYLTGN